VHLNRYEPTPSVLWFLTPMRDPECDERDEWMIMLSEVGIRTLRGILCFLFKGEY